MGYNLDRHKNFIFLVLSLFSLLERATQFIGEHRKLALACCSHRVVGTKSTLRNKSRTQKFDFKVEKEICSFEGRHIAAQILVESRRTARGFTFINPHENHNKIVNQKKEELKRCSLASHGQLHPRRGVRNKAMHSSFARGASST